MTYRFPIHVGDRVAIAPHHDLWMAGCRFGRVEISEQSELLGRSGRFYYIRLDTGRAVTLHEDDLLGAVGDSPVVESATPSTVFFDSETHDYSLSDCAWYDQPQASRPWWARDDCSGPRVGDTEHGVLCEGHYNAIPAETESP